MFKQVIDPGKLKPGQKLYWVDAKGVRSTSVIRVLANGRVIVSGGTEKGVNVNLDVPSTSWSDRIHYRKDGYVPTTTSESRAKAFYSFWLRSQAKDLRKEADAAMAKAKREFVTAHRKAQQFERRAAKREP